MKYVIAVLIFIHGMIHLFGFARAFNLTQIDLTEMRISRFQGVLWFTAFLLFAFSGEAYLSNNASWHWIALAAIAVSTALLSRVWKAARYGMIPDSIILVMALYSISADAFNRRLSNEISEMLNRDCPAVIGKVRTEQVDTLPYPVSKWLKTAGVIGKERIHTVRLRQNARMKMNPDQKDWYEAEAWQYINADDPAFIWRVKMNIPPFIEITGRDKFFDGTGEMKVRLFSLFNIANEKGDKVDEGAMQRFLAETVWFPTAALSDYIKWDMIDSLSARATMHYKGKHVSGVFYFNPEGDFTGFSCLRYKDNAPDARRYEWSVTAKAYSTFNGIKIPVEAEVSWRLDSGKWTWLDLEVKKIWYSTDTLID